MLLCWRIPVFFLGVIPVPGLGAEAADFFYGLPFNYTWFTPEDLLLEGSASDKGGEREVVVDGIIG